MVPDSLHSSHQPFELECGKIEEDELLVQGVSMHGDVSRTLRRRGDPRVRSSARFRLLYLAPARPRPDAKLRGQLPVLLRAYGRRAASHLRASGNGRSGPTGRERPTASLCFLPY